MEFHLTGGLREPGWNEGLSHRGQGMRELGRLSSDSCQLLVEDCSRGSEALVLLVFPITKSYRCWQLKHGLLCLKVLSAEGVCAEQMASLHGQSCRLKLWESEGWRDNRICRREQRHGAQDVGEIVWRKEEGSRQGLRQDITWGFPCQIHKTGYVTVVQHEGYVMCYETDL